MRYQDAPYRTVTPTGTPNTSGARGRSSATTGHPHGLTGTNRERPGLHQALAACRAGDTLVVTKLDRLARSLPDARAIADELTQREVKLNLHDPTDPVGRLLFNVLAMVAEFESDLIRMRTREGMKVAKAKGRLRGKQPKLSATQEAHLVKLYRAGEHTISELEELFPSPDRRSTARSRAQADERPRAQRRRSSRQRWARGSVRRVSATEHEQLPPIATIPDIVEALRRLGVGVGPTD